MRVVRVLAELEIERGDDCQEVELKVEATVLVEVDEAYGADADGNRGWSETFVTIEDVDIKLPDGSFFDETSLTSAELEQMKERLLDAAREARAVAADDHADYRRGL